ncbi:hypothetical protein [Kocuria aegyptia]
MAWVQNRFWLLVPVLVLNLVLVGRLPPPLTPGSAGPDIPSWLAVSETLLRVVVFGAPLLMPLRLRAPGTRTALTVYGFGFAAYVAAWAVVIWAPTSSWSTSAVGFTALAWTPLLFLIGIGKGSTLRSVPGYRPWMYLAAAVLFTAVHTAAMVITWAWYYA